MRVKIARNKYGFYVVSFYAFNRWIRSGNDAFKTYADAVNWVNDNLGSNHTLETY